MGEFENHNNCYYYHYMFSLPILVSDASYINGEGAVYEKLLSLSFLYTVKLYFTLMIMMMMIF